MEVFLDQSNYMKNRLSKKAGGKIVIHDPNTPPLPNEYGLELRPNTASSIAVQKNDIKRMAFPFTPNCTSAWNGTVYNVRTDTAYTFAVSNFAFFDGGSFSGLGGGKAFLEGSWLQGDVGL